MAGIGDTLTARLRARARSHRHAPAYLYRAGTEAAWTTFTWQQVLERVERLASAFVGIGLQAGERVAIMLPTCPDWEICHHAALAAGAVVVGLDRQDSEQNLTHILGLAEPRMIIAQTAADIARLGALWPGAGLLVVVERIDRAPAPLALADLIATPGGPPLPPDQAPRPHDTATIVFTSGSTGKPKGIAYSHHQIILAIDALQERFPTVRGEARMVCWLPLANLFQRILNLFALSCGARSYFVDRPEDVLRFAPDMRPTLFVGVPRFFEKLHQGILARVNQQPRLLRALVLAAWDIGCRHAAASRSGARAPLWVRLLFPLSRSLLRRIRSLLGPDLKFMVSGSAALPPWLLERFHGLGWLVLEAYGISENVMPVSTNQVENYRFGSVGRPLPGNELRFAADGELLLRGSGVFRGYLRETTPPDTLDADGFLHTGDFARLDDDGYLWLEGRKSEIFKTSTGRRISPVPIEIALKQIESVDHAVVVGRDRPFPVALLTLDPRSSRLAALGAPTTRTAIAHDVSAACRAFPEHQRPGAVIVSRTALTVAGGELTANLKLCRRQIEVRFAAEIDEAYQEASQQMRRAPAAPPIIEAP
ncbi:MAG: AMP-binding protein [Proteobacteria bacterium]|nr:AMP-binding protein [Pseudomonadota bacterium]